MTRMRRELVELTIRGADLEYLLLELDFFRVFDLPDETITYPGGITGY
jgi:hypothetical protein